jgi:hypothetical protein
MTAAKADALRSAIAAVLAVVLSVSSVAAITFYFFLFGRPDGGLRTPLTEFLAPAVGIYLLFTLVSAAVGAWLWRAPAALFSFLAASPYLLLAATGCGILWLGIALFTFGVQYLAIYFRRAGPHRTVA